MQSSEATQQVELYIANAGTWYENITETMKVTVSNSGEDQEYYITEGEHAGKHILKADCKPVEGVRLTV